MKRKYKPESEETYKFSKCKLELKSIENDIFLEELKSIEIYYKNLLKDKIHKLDCEYNNFIIGKKETINMVEHDINVNINYLSHYSFYT